MYSSMFVRLTSIMKFEKWLIVNKGLDEIDHKGFYAKFHTVNEKYQAKKVVGKQKDPKKRPIKFWRSDQSSHFKEY